MAPMIRSDGSPYSRHPGSFMNPQDAREGSWEFTESERQSVGSRDESEEPASYEDDHLEYRDENDGSQGSPALLEGPENNEDILHPLREAANRVGREVERFAEVLDGYNPLKAADEEERHGMTFELIELYHNISLETVERLRSQHASERRKQDGARWRKKMHGFKISQDPELMDMDDMEDSGPSALGSTNTTIKDLERWEEEARTWDLLSRIVKLQYPDSGQRRASNQQPERIHRYSSERQIWEAFLEADHLALERQTVLTWLQDTADESGEDIDVLVQELQQNAERGDIIAHGWLHTKAAIKNQKRVHVWPHVLDPSSPDVQRIHLNSAKTEPLVTQLDPDAPTRQNRKLEVQDQYFERAIWLGCYEMLRRGKSAEEIREWCGDRTEIWRAASMCGLLDDGDENHDSNTDNTSSTLWRRMCFALARRGGSDEYERAVYGILSGDLSTIEPVCRTWNDHLFAHYNALVKSQFENYLQVQHPSRVPADMVQAYGMFDAVQFHGEPQTTGKRLVNSLNKASKEGSATTRTMKMLQGVLIAKEFDNFIYQQGLALSKLANAETESILIPKINISPEKEDINVYIALNDYDSLRVLVHMLLAFKSLGLNLGDMVQQMAIENVIVAYIGFLRLAGKEELIPLYASQLTGDRLYATLSRELVDVTDPEQRVTQIKLMKELGLDVQKFVRFQTQFLFMDFPDESRDYPADRTFHLLEDDQTPGCSGKRVMTGFIGTEIDRTDLLLIRSLEWYLLVDGLWSETFATGVLLYKRFFKHAKLAAAAELSRSVSSSLISQNKTLPLLGESFDIVDLENDGEQEDITERIGDSATQMKLLKRYLAGEAKSFRELELLNAALEYIEFASESISAMANSSDKGKKESRINLHKALQPTKITVNLLLKDWLCTSQKEEPEFKQLREAYLPEIILAYDKILHFSGIALSRDNFLECMELSTIIAAEDSDLADMFVKKGRMKELVAAFADNSKALLQANIPGKSRIGTTSKKLRNLGWTRELWDIKL